MLGLWIWFGVQQTFLLRQLSCQAIDVFFLGCFFSLNSPSPALLSAKKMPSRNAAHMAELVWALATLRAGFVLTPLRIMPVQRTNFSLLRSRALPAAAMAHIMLGRRRGVSERSGSSDEEEAAGSLLDEEEGDGVAGRRGLGLFDDDHEGDGMAGPGPGSLQSFRMAQRSLGSQTGEAAGLRGDSQSSTLHRSSTLCQVRRQPDVASPVPGPGAAAWAAEGRGSPLAWAELQRCAGLALMTEISQQRRHKTQEEGSDGGGSSYGGGSVAEVLPAGRLGVRALSRMAWGFAVAGQHDAALFQLIEDAALGLSGGLQASDPGALACLAYAFARAGVACPRLMPLLSRAFSIALRRHPVPTGARLPSSGGSPSITGARLPSSGGSPSITGAWPQTGDADLAAEASESVCAADTAPSEQGTTTTVCGADVARLMWAMAALQLKDSEVLHTLCSVLPGARFRSVTSQPLLRPNCYTCPPSPSL